MSEWRYIAQRALTGEFLHFDVPMSRDELTWDLSGPGSLRGTVSPEVGQLRAADGSPLFDEWGTFIYAEADGTIRWGGIVISSEFNGAAWAIEAAGFTTYPHGIPYQGSYTQASVDPFDAVREIWRFVQTSTNGNLGLAVGSGSTPVRLGTPAKAAFPEVFLDGFWIPRSQADPSLIVPSQSAKLKHGIDNNDTSLTMQSLGGFDTLGLPFTVAIGSERILVGSRSGTTLSDLSRGVDGTKATGHQAGTAVNRIGTPTRTEPAADAQPYTLLWWDAPDCGDEIDSLAQETPFDYVESHAWADDGSITHTLQLGYPRLGGRRTDLAFVEGDNISNVITATRDGSVYANEVIGFGAGEGRSSLRVQLPDPDGRLRRPVVYTDKSITTIPRLTALSRTQLTRWQQVLEITSIDVIAHPNARIGSWQLGDDILVSADLPWLGRVDLWSRVVGWSLISDSRATLTLARSSSFYYGSPPQS